MAKRSHDSGPDARDVADYLLILSDATGKKVTATLDAAASDDGRSVLYVTIQASEGHGLVRSADVLTALAQFPDGRHSSAWAAVWYACWLYDKALTQNKFPAP